MYVSLSRLTLVVRLESLTYSSAPESVRLESLPHILCYSMLQCSFELSKNISTDVSGPVTLP